MSSNYSSSSSFPPYLTPSTSSHNPSPSYPPPPYTSEPAPVPSFPIQQSNPDEFQHIQTYLDSIVRTDFDSELASILTRRTTTMESAQAALQRSSHEELTNIGNRLWSQHQAQLKAALSTIAPQTPAPQKPAPFASTSQQPAPFTATPISTPPTSSTADIARSRGVNILPPPTQSSMSSFSAYPSAFPAAAYPVSTSTPQALQQNVAYPVYKQPYSQQGSWSGSAYPSYASASSNPNAEALALIQSKVKYEDQDQVQRYLQLYNKYNLFCTDKNKVCSFLCFTCFTCS